MGNGKCFPCVNLHTEPAPTRSSTRFAEQHLTADAILQFLPERLNHTQAGSTSSRENSYNKIYKMTRTSDMPTTTPAAGSLSGIRLSMLATCAGAHHGHVTEIPFVWLARPVATLRGGCHLMPGCSSGLILFLGRRHAWSYVQPRGFGAPLKCLPLTTQ